MICQKFEKDACCMLDNIGVAMKNTLMSVSLVELD